MIAIKANLSLYRDISLLFYKSIRNRANDNFHWMRDGVCHIGINIAVFDSCTTTILDPFFLFLFLYDYLWNTLEFWLSLTKEISIHVQQNGSKNSVQLTIIFQMKKRNELLHYFQQDILDAIIMQNFLLSFLYASSQITVLMVFSFFFSSFFFFFWISLYAKATRS